MLKIIINCISTRRSKTMRIQAATNMVVVRLSASPFSLRSSMAFWASTCRLQFLKR